MFRGARLIPTLRRGAIGRPMRRHKPSRTVSTRRLTVVLAVFAAGILATGMSAQEKPYFTGAWTVSELPAAPAAGGDGPRVSLGSGWGESFTLLQDSNMLTVERVLYRPRDYQPTMKLRYALDGSESRNTFMMGRGMQVQVSTAAWESDKLVITMVHTVPDVEVGRTVRCEVTQTLSLEPPRQAVGESSLVIETRRCGVLGGLPSTTRTVYDRK